MVALFQIPSALRDVSRNTRRIIDSLGEAHRRGALLALFPELSLTGYLLDKEMFDGELAQEIEKARRSIAEVCRETGVEAVISYPEVVRSNEIYITAEWIHPSGERSFHRKLYLANYGHCRDHEIYTAGNRIDLFSSAVGPAALLICEDGWHLSASTIAAQKGAKIIMVIAATSALTRRGGDALRNQWKTIGTAVALTNTSYFIYCNCAGEEGKKIFCGGSFAVAPDGDLPGGPLGDKEGVSMIPVDINKLNDLRASVPLVKNERNDIV